MMGTRSTVTETNQKWWRTNKEQSEQTGIYTQTTDHKNKTQLR